MLIQSTIVTLILASTVSGAVDCDCVSNFCLFHDASRCVGYQVPASKFCTPGTFDVCKGRCVNTGVNGKQDTGCPPKKTKICVKSDGTEPGKLQAGDDCVRCVNSPKPNGVAKGCWKKKPLCYLNGDLAPPGVAGDSCVAPVPCGGLDEACCDTPETSPCDSDDLGCINDMCVGCGSEFDPCCTGSTCNGNDLSCGSSDTCEKSCGRLDEPCCIDGSNPACNGNDLSCGSSNTCEKSCGALNMNCCEDGDFPECDSASPFCVLYPGGASYCQSSNCGFDCGP